VPCPSSLRPCDHRIDIDQGTCGKISIGPRAKARSGTIISRPQPSGTSCPGFVDAMLWWVTRIAGACAHAMTAAGTTKEPWSEAETHCKADEIALKSPQADAAEAQADFESARGCSRAPGKAPGAARGDMHGPTVGRSGRTTAGLRSSRPHLWPVHRRLDARDLKEAKALLDEGLRSRFTKQEVGRLENESDSRS
jgi:hypothetical protein